MDLIAFIVWLVKWTTCHMHCVKIPDDFLLAGLNNPVPLVASAIAVDTKDVARHMFKRFSFLASVSRACIWLVLH